MTLLQFIFTSVWLYFSLTLLQFDFTSVWMNELLVACTSRNLCCRSAIISWFSFKSQNPRFINKSGFKSRAAYDGVRTVLWFAVHITQFWYYSTYILSEHLPWIFLFDIFSHLLFHKISFHIEQKAVEIHNIVKNVKQLSIM